MESKLRTPSTGGVRYAPSPTGRLHLGNLRTAWISRDLARRMGLPWIVRFEDIDRARVLPDARAQQLGDLQRLGLVPDRVFDQSAFGERHWSLFLRAMETGDVYPCTCSRQEVAADLLEIASAPHSGVAPVYSGHCRKTKAEKSAPSEAVGWRFRMPDESGHEDFIVARVSREEIESGRRQEFVPAYHWACAIDDRDGGYDVLVRASDLRTATRLQRALHAAIGRLERGTAVTLPAVFNASLVVRDNGARLEKRTRAVTLDELGPKGVTPQDVAELFEKSFTWNAFAELTTAERISIETPEMRTLTSLGFT